MRAFAALIALSLAAPAIAAGRDDALKPVSVAFAEQGRTALAAGNTQAAIDAFEAALASDPRNVAAFSGMAQAYEKLGLPGKAVKFYREALLINPSDLSALEGQGKAYVARGATARAQINLARLKALCKPGCPEAGRLQAAINTAAVAQAEPAKKTASN